MIPGIEDEEKRKAKEISIGPNILITSKLALHVPIIGG